MKKRVLVILGHPSVDSLNRAIADSYFKGAKKNFDVKKIYLSELKFDVILHEGYKKIQTLEPDLVSAQKLIEWAEHIVFIYPLWWLSPPALLKGFIDRTFVPGFAFKYKDKSPFPLRFLKGKTATIINTVGGPKSLYFFIGWMVKKPMTLGFLRFCGIKSKHQKYFCSINKDLKKDEVKKILKKATQWGEEGI